MRLKELRVARAALNVSVRRRLALAIREIIDGQAVVPSPTRDTNKVLRVQRRAHPFRCERHRAQPHAGPRSAAEWRAELEAKGHQLQTARRRWGNMQAVYKSRASSLATAASDPRGSDIGDY